MEEDTDYDTFLRALQQSVTEEQYEVSGLMHMEENILRVTTEQLSGVKFVVIFDLHGKRFPEVEGFAPANSDYEIRIPENPDFDDSGFWAICVAINSNSSDHPLFPVCQKASLPGASIMADKTRPLHPDRVYEGYLYSKSGNPFPFDKVAVKMDERFRDVKSVDREFRLAGKVTSPYVVKYYAWNNLTSKEIQRGRAVWMAMELCQRKTLHDYISNRQLTSDQKKIAATHLLLGLSHLHGHGILHRDLTLHNIFFSKSGNYLKIGDLDHVKQSNPGTGGISMSRGYEKLYQDLQDFKKNIENRRVRLQTYNLETDPTEYRAEDDVLLAAVIIFQCFTDSIDPHEGLSGKWYGQFFIQNREAQLSFANNKFRLEEPVLGFELIKHMINDQPTAEDSLKHPFFWNAKKKKDFIVQMNNFFWPFVNTTKNPKSPKEARCYWIIGQIIDGLRQTWSGNIETDFKKTRELVITKGSYGHHQNRVKKQLLALEKKAGKDFPGNVDIFRLLTFIRNVCTHYHEKEETSKYFESYDEVWKCFSLVFPFLLSDVFSVIRNSWQDLAECEDFPIDAHHFFTAGSAPLLNLTEE